MEKLFIKLGLFCALELLSAGTFNVEGNMEMVVEHLEQLLERPLKINSAGRGEFKEMVLLTDFQIESILDYRQKSGDILSASQLELLHGFDEKTVTMLKPFISFEGSGTVLFNPLYDTLSARNIFKRCDSQLWTKTVMKNLGGNGSEDNIGAPASVLIKYKSVYDNKLQVGLTLENDAGESLFAKGAPPVDFISFHAAAKNIGRMNMLVLGDYAVRFGQGLSIWNSFSLQALSTPMAFHKKGSAITPYTSSDESNFCRGAAASFSFGKLDLNAFFSANRETMGGANISYMFDNLKLGASFVTYGYNGGNVAFDFYTIIKGVKLFGEAAIDYGGSTAALLGAVFNVSDKFEAGVMLRSYSKSYIAPHAGAYSTISSVSNQRGLALNGVYSISQKWRAVFNLEGCHYPWKRFNINAGSSMVKGHIAGEYVGNSINVAAKLSDSYTSHNRLNRLTAGVQMAITSKGRFEAKLHASCVSAVNIREQRGRLVYDLGYSKVSDTGVENNSVFGWQVGTGLKYKTINDRVAAYIGGSIFSTPDWNCRIYIYEPDLPYTFGSRLLYGNGCRLYAMCKAELFKNIWVYLKYQTLQYVNGDKAPSSELKFAAKIKF